MEKKNEEENEKVKQLHGKYMESLIREEIHNNFKWKHPE